MILLCRLGFHRWRFRTRWEYGVIYTCRRCDAEKRVEESVTHDEEGK
jgi:RNase P subunit RPR2